MVSVDGNLYSVPNGARRRIVSLLAQAQSGNALAASAGKPDAWIVSTKDKRPQYGDILRHTIFHVDVAIGFDGDILLRAAGGQGGPPVHDIVNRVRGLGPYDWTKLKGWIDIDIFFATT